MDDPRNDALADEVVRRLSEVFGPPHERLRSENEQLHRDNAGIQQQIAALYERLDHIERRMDGLERKGGYNYLVDEARKAASASGCGSNEALRPHPGMSRPIEIDEACAAQPGNPRMVFIPECGLEIEPEPGSDPEVVWLETQRAIASATEGRENDRNAVRRSRRARRH